MRLSSGNAGALNGGVALPGYSRSALASGIVHFGIGAFHRAHQEVYTEDVMGAGHRDWGIIGVLMRSTCVADQLNPQDGLFTVTERGDGNGRLINLPSA